MSRKNKNFRAFIHQNPDANVQDAWDAAWKNRQDKFRSLTMQDLQEENVRLRDIWEKYEGNATNLHIAMRNHFYPIGKMIEPKEQQNG